MGPVTALCRHDLVGVHVVADVKDPLGRLRRLSDRLTVALEAFHLGHVAQVGAVHGGLLAHRGGVGDGFLHRRHANGLTVHAFSGRERRRPLDSIRRGRDPESDGMEGLRDIATVEAVYRSVRENRTVPIEPEWASVGGVGKAG